MAYNDDPHLEILQEQVETYAGTFRWLWILNAAAVVWGIMTEHYEVVAVSGASATIAMVGVGMVRRGLKSVARAINRCQDIRKSRMRA